MSIDFLFELATFTLRKHSVNATFAIISLNKKEWRKVAEEQIAIDSLAYNTMREIQKLLGNGVNVNGDVENKIGDSMVMERHITAEYERALNLEEQLNSTSIIFNIQNMRITKVFKKTQPFMYKLYLKNKNKDFLILLNTNLLSSCPMEETHLSIAHETLHFVDACFGNRTPYNDIEKKAKMIVDEFLTCARA